MFAFGKKGGGFGKLKMVDPFAICNDPKFNEKMYDAVVIGGGSGGLAFALEARNKG